MSSYIKTALDVLNYLIKFVQVGTSVVDSVRAYKDENLTTGEKVVIVGANSLFIVAQTADLAVDVHEWRFSPASDREIRAPIELMGPPKPQHIIDLETRNGLLQRPIELMPPRVTLAPSLEGRVAPELDLQGRIIPGSGRSDFNRTETPDKERMDETHRFLIKIGVGVSDVTRQVAVKIVKSKRNNLDIHDYCQILGTVCFRAGEIMDFTAQTGTLLSEVNVDKIEAAGRISQACSNVFSNSVRIENFGKLIKEKIANARLHRENLRKQQAVIIPNPQITLVETMSDHEAGAIIWGEMKEALDTQRITHLNKIPAFFNEDLILNLRRCAINSAPIRFFMQIRGSIKENPIFYDRENIKKWFLEHPQERPPSWPTSMNTYSLELLEDFNSGNSETEKIQNEIDARLEALLDDMRTSIIDMARTENRPS